MPHATHARRPPAARKSKAARAATEKPADARAGTTAAANSKPPAYMQAKLAISHPQDNAEKEADKVGRQVARAAREAPAEPADKQQKTAQRESLEPGVEVETTKAKDEVIAPKPVPEAENIQRLTPPPSATPEQQTDTKSAATAATAASTKPPQTVQREAADALAGQQTSAETEQRIEARRGAGGGLPKAVEDEMSARFNQDFSGVHIHTDKEAGELCTETNARAFTVGNDIFFAPGEFAPDSDAGRELLAHELTHVVQQGGAVQRRIQREPATGPGDSKKKTGKGTLKNGNQLFIPQLILPKKPGMEEKFGSNTNWKLPPEKEARGDQSADWINGIKGKAKKDKLTPLLGNDNTLPDTDGGPARFALKLGASNSYVIGTDAEIFDKVTLPWWDTGGTPHTFHVDHILELQLGGSATDTSNFQLLDASANTSSGIRTKNAIDKAIRDAVPPEVEGSGTVPDDLAKKIPKSKKSSKASSNAADSAAAPATAATPGNPAATPAKDDAMTAVKGKYEIIFETVDFSGAIGGKPNVKWLFDSVADMQHLAPLTKATASNAKELYETDSLRLFPRPGAGVLFTPKLEGEPGSETFKGGEWGKLTVGGGTFDRNAGTGTVNIGINGKNVSADGQTGLSFASIGSPTLCAITPGQVAAAFRTKFKAKSLSPIVLNNADLDASANFVGGGTLTIDGIPILAGVTLDVSIVGGDIVFSKTFSTDEFDIKGPIQLDSSSLTLSAGAATPIQADGQVDFHIGELAKGQLNGSATANGFKLGGQLDVEKNLFTGSGRVDYDSNTGMKASGTLGLKPGALKGVKKASFTLAYDDAKGAIDFSGNADLSVPGFKGATLAATADQEGNISLAGEATLSETIPRIKAGKLNVSAQKKGDNWDLGGGGELEPDLSGLDSSAKLALTYGDGILNGKLTAAYARGMLAGNVNLNAKAAIGDGGGEAEPMKVWGGGKVDVKAAPWLKATVGLTLDEKGEITVAGELGLPSSLEIFPRKEINKSLFSVATQVPIVPGIVAEVGGNLTANAGIGPGKLDQLKVGIEYNPDQEQNTRIFGSVHLNVPADAGLRLGARAGIGLGITGASATGGLELGGTLGIDGAAEASANVNWTPTTGLDIKTEGYIHAEPKFKFDVSGYVAVTALGVSVYDNRWELAAYEVGSNLKLGARFPINYKEGQDFKVSLEDVKFEVPDINPSAMIDQVIGAAV